MDERNSCGKKRNEGDTRVNKVKQGQQDDSLDLSGSMWILWILCGSVNSSGRKEFMWKEEKTR
ncbi:hypothetical protein GCM10025777_56760 [Membranihabitans marinus]